MVLSISLNLSGCGKGDTAPTGGAETVGKSLTGTKEAEAGNASSEPPVLKAKVRLLYEKSGEKWIEEAVKDVNEASKGAGAVTADYRGSREGKQAILYGKFQKDTPDAPILWNPADAYWFGKLNQDWKDPKYGNKKGDHTQNVVDDPKIILNTRLVLVMWKNRADVFQKAMQTPKYQNKTWSLIRDIATKGWAAPGIGGTATWGKLKLAQSNPIKSNSGQTTLRLIFDEYLRTNPSGKTTDPQFISWMKDIEGGVKGGFADTTSNALTAMLSGGESAFDMAIAYEQNALTLADSGEARLKIVYPTPTVAVNFPISVVKAEWVSDRQYQDARAFTKYLLSPKVQERSTQYGFRPGDTTLRSDVAGKLNTPAHSAIGFQLEPQLESTPAPTEVIDSLLYLWNNQYGDKTTADAVSAPNPSSVPAVPPH